MIEIRNLLIKRNGRNTLEIDSLDIQRGETLTVVGPNGAGKSTLLLALARLLRPSQGEIIYDGKTLKQWNELEYRRKISFARELRYSSSTVTSSGYSLAFARFIAFCDFI